MNHTRHTVTLWILRIFVSVIALVYGLTWLLSPWVTRHVMKDVLAPLDLALTPKSQVRYNPFLSSVTIHDLALHHDEQKIAEIKNAKIDIQLFRLLSKTLYVSTFDVDGVYFIVAINNGELSFGEYSFPTSEKAEDKSEEKVKEGVKEGDKKGAKEKSFIDKVVLDLPKLQIKNVNIDFSIDGNSYPIVFNDITLSEVLASQENVTFEHQLAAGVLGGEFTLKAQANTTLEESTADLKISLKGIDLALLSPLFPEAYGLNKGELDFSTDLSLEREESGLVVSNKNLNLTVSSLNQSVRKELLTLDKAALVVENSDLTLENNAITSLELTGSLELGDTLLENTEKNIQYLSMQSLTLASIFAKGSNIKSEEKEITFDIDVAETILSQLVLSKRNNKAELPALLTLNEISIAGLSYRAESLFINDILFSGLESYIYIDESGELSTLVDISSLQEKPTESGDSDTSQEEIAPQVASSEESESTFPVGISKISVSEKNSIHFRDRSVNPHYVRDVHLDRFEVSDINSSSEELSPFVLVGRSNEYAKFNLKGGIAPFSKKHNFKVKGDVKEISLHSVSPYVRDGLGFEFDSGQLDTDIDVSSSNAELDGTITLKMRGLEMTATQNVKPDSLADQSSIPLNVALGMLKDSRGNIKLDVPVKGSTDDPSFGFNDILVLITKKAVMSQAKSYLMQTFVPYASVVSVAIAAGEFALKVRFEDLPYKPGQIEIDEDQKEYALEFIALMHDKEDTQVKVCGISTPEDIGLEAGKEVKDEEKVKELLNIAKGRAEAFKKHAVEEGKLDSYRLLICQPKIDFGEKAKPHLSISL